MLSRGFLICVLALLSGCASTRLFHPYGYSPELDEKAGFRDLKFGTPFESVKGLFEDCKDDKTTPGAIVCRRKDENLRVGDATVRFIFYTFYEGSFSGAYATCDGIENSLPLLEALRAAYGNPDKPNQFISSYEWHSSTAEMTFEMKIGSDDGVLMVWSPEIRRREEAAAHSRAAASDL